MPSSLFQYHMTEQLHFSYPREIKSYMSILKDVYIYVYSNLIDNSFLKPSMKSRSESDSHSVVSDSLWPHGLYSLPSSSVHGILQARILECVVIPFSRGSFQSRDITQVSCTAGRFFTIWAIRKAFNGSVVMNNSTSWNTTQQWKVGNYWYIDVSPESHGRWKKPPQAIYTTCFIFVNGPNYYNGEQIIDS